MRNGADTIIRAFEGARSMWQKDIRLINGVHRLELISIGKSLVLVQDYPKGEGWQAFAPVTDDGRIDATLEAIAKHCGVDAPSVEHPGHSEETIASARHEEKLMDYDRAAR